MRTTICAAALIAALIAGAASDTSSEAVYQYSADDAAPTITQEAGSSFEMILRTVGNEVTRCYLTAPSGAVIDFVPKTDYDEHKYSFRDNLMSGCTVDIQNLDEQDNGVWVLSYDNASGLVDSQSYNVVVTGTEIVAETENEEDNENSNEDKNTEQDALTVHQDVGSSLEMILRTVGDEVQRCYLTTPEGNIIDFVPKSAYDDEKYEFRENVLSGCTVAINNLNTNDNGVWLLSYDNASGLVDTLTYNVIVTGTETDTSDEDGLASAEEKDDASAELTTEKATTLAAESEDKDVNESVEEDILYNTTQYQSVRHTTLAGSRVDATLSKADYDEECYLITNTGKEIITSGLDISGITVQKSSEYVSCRVVFEPIDNSHAGDWSLCARRVVDNFTYNRCQPFNIFIRAVSWTVHTSPEFNHVVNLDGILSPAVTGTGEPETCHIITPNGEDIVVNPDSDYPYLKYVPANNWVCSIAIGPIKNTMLSTWTIYGKFQSFVYGVNEARFTFDMRLYDENNPHDQAYNVSIADPVTRAVNLGNTAEFDITSSGTLDACTYTTPTGQTISNDDSTGLSSVSFLASTSSNQVSCRIAVGPITNDLLGKWLLVGKFSNRVFTEIHQEFTIVLEDPANPITEDDRLVQYLNDRSVEVGFGEALDLTIGRRAAAVAESCHIRTPDGLQFTLMDGFHLNGVDIINDENAVCGVQIRTDSEDVIGEWVLISRETFLNERMERRLRFSISIEEHVAASPESVVIAEGNDLYIRLEAATTLYNTCVLNGPRASPIYYEIDSRYVETCGFIVKDITKEDAGNWTISYGTKLSYRATTIVTVKNQEVVPDVTLDLIRGQTIARSMGPGNEYYCQIKDPRGIVIYDEFDLCMLILESVNTNHDGIWTMTWTVHGRVVAEEHKFAINVIVPDTIENPVKVNTTVEMDHEAKALSLSCAALDSTTVNRCLFRDPSGRVLLANQGVGEDRYSFHGQTINVESGVTSNSCGLRITNVTVSDMGIWRCTVVTAGEISEVGSMYYGFLNVSCPWALSDPEVAASVISEPVLTAVAPVINGITDKSFKMQCSVQSAIQYCYFRSPNGTIFNVYPRIASDSSSLSYDGAGFEAGECSVRGQRLSRKDNGTWSCHVGLYDGLAEQHADIDLIVSDLMSVEKTNRDGNLVIEASVHGNIRLARCRFVRADGLGFSVQNMPWQYLDRSNFYNGYCGIYIPYPEEVDHQQWVVTVLVHGEDTERSGTTNELDVPGFPDFMMRPPPATRALDIMVFIFLMSVSSLALYYIFCAPRKQEQRLQAIPDQQSRWSLVRFSHNIRNSFNKKKPQENDAQVIVNTPNAV